MLLQSVLHYRILVKIRYEKAKTLVQNAIALNTKQVWTHAYSDLAWHNDNGLRHVQKGILKQWFLKAGNFFRNLGKMGKRIFFFQVLILFTYFDNNNHWWYHLHILHQVVWKLRLWFMYLCGFLPLMVMRPYVHQYIPYPNLKNNKRQLLVPWVWSKVKRG